MNLINTLLLASFISTGGAPIVGWLLATGFWDDAAPWNDSQNWID